MGAESARQIFPHPKSSHNKIQLWYTNLRHSLEIGRKLKFQISISLPPTIRLEIFFFKLEMWFSLITIGTSIKYSKCNLTIFLLWLAAYIDLRESNCPNSLSTNSASIQTFLNAKYCNCWKIDPWFNLIIPLTWGVSYVRLRTTKMFYPPYSILWFFFCCI